LDVVTKATYTSDEHVPYAMVHAHCQWVFLSRLVGSVLLRVESALSALVIHLMFTLGGTVTLVAAGDTLNRPVEVFPFLLGRNPITWVEESIFN